MWTVHSSLSYLSEWNNVKESVAPESGCSRGKKDRFLAVSVDIVGDVFLRPMCCFRNWAIDVTEFEFEFESSSSSEDILVSVNLYSDVLCFLRGFITRFCSVLTSLWCIAKSCSSFAELSTGCTAWSLSIICLLSNWTLIASRLRNVSFFPGVFVCSMCSGDDDIILAILSISFTFSNAISCRLSSISCIFFGRTAKCFKVIDKTTLIFVGTL